jgi:class 3 adenylate cyclase
MTQVEGIKPSQERLLVTVLFADIIGFSALTDQIKPEEVGVVTGDLWGEFKQIIKEHGGVIANQVGDTLMVTWGAPKSQEDDTEKAVFASLELLNGLARFKESTAIPAAKSLGLRMGIHTGLALAGNVGVRGEYTVLGETVKIAKRMQECGQPGILVVSEATYQSIRGAFQAKRLDPVQLLDTQALVNIFQIVEELPQPTKLRYRNRGGLETNLVGRSSEMDLLAEVYLKTQEDNKPKLALITGDVGVGKSRLLFEFAGHLETENPLITVMSSRALEQTSQFPYYLWKEFWSNRFEINEDDPLEVSQKKTIDGVLTMWGRALGEVTAMEVAHFLGSLIGVSWEQSRYLDPYQSKQKERIERAFQMIGELLMRAAQRGPVVLILDDLQWADSGSLRLIKYLWKSIERDLPLLILSSARNEFLENGDIDFNDAERIELNPLPVSAEIVRDAYPALKNESEKNLLALAEKAQGNPYYLEEMVKNIVASGEVDEARINKLPKTLETLLKSRLDSLSLEGRATAYFASVSGRVFWKGSVLAAYRGAPGVTEVLDVSSHNLVGKVQRSLDELMEKELAFLRVGSSFAGDREYIFKHSLLQEVAYDRLPDDLKTACHHAVANWLADRVGLERSISVAHHFEKAGIYDRAQEFYTLAAEHSRSLGSFKEADDIVYYARTLPDDRFR